MKTRMGLVALATAAMLSLSSNAMALTKRTFCVFDIIGANGDTFNIMRDYKTAAVAWGVDVELKPYTDEKIASVAGSSTATPAAWILSAPSPVMTP